MVREYRKQRKRGFWPEQMVPLCYWGCDIYTGYYAEDGRLIRMATDSECFYLEKHQSEKWFQAWMQGKDLFNAVVNKALESP